MPYIILIPTFSKLFNSYKSHSYHKLGWFVKKMKLHENAKIYTSKVVQQIEIYIATYISTDYLKLTPWQSIAIGLFEIENEIYYYIACCTFYITNPNMNLTVYINSFIVLSH